MSDSRKPAVFRLDPVAPERPAEDVAPAAPRDRKAARAIVIAEVPDAFAPPPLVPSPVSGAPAPSRLSVWTKLFWSALGGLVSLAIGLWFWRLVDDLFRTNVYVGWLGVALVALGGLALAVLLVREVIGLLRLSAVTELRTAAESAAATDDGPAAKRVVKTLLARDGVPTTARQQLEAAMDEIIDGRGLLSLADRSVMQPRDELAKAAIASAAKRVSVVTAISPRALVDILFVAAQSVILIRRIAAIYGARPGSLGFLRLLRRILGHLAITGGVALSDSVLSQLVGQGVAARLSAKLGEGVLNGLLTARVGLAAIVSCRPLPFLAGEEPRLQDVAGEILGNPLGKEPSATDRPAKVKPD